MRPARYISAEEENFRTEPMFPGDDEFARIEVLKRDPVEPEPVGSIVLKAFRIVEYDQDCDGSLMARLENVDAQGQSTGWAPDCLGIDQRTTLVLENEQELRSLFRQ